MTRAILLIEDEVVLARNVCTYLERAGHETRHAESAEDGLAQLQHWTPDAVVLDFNLPGINGLEALARIHAQHPRLPVLMLTGHGDVEMAVQAMRGGAHDFMTKPVALSQLRARIERAFDGPAAPPSGAAGGPSQGAGSGALDALIGESAAMGALKQTLRTLIDVECRLRDGDPPAVLLLGETGTGKEVVARALHLQGPRAHKPFVELNCAALPAQLLESELFGHERGAFTDARERKPGLVETAQGGTLFLDEIGDMDLALQAKLLKLLEEKVVRRLGSVREQKVDVRIVAATHRSLDELVRAGRFRADLYYRLCVVQLRLPPLRERGADIALLARHFVGQHAARYGKPTPALSAAALAALQAHRWPGNVRELRNLLEQVVVLGSSPTIEPQQLALPVAPAPAAFEASGAMPLAAAGAPAATLADLERDALIRALNQHGWNVSRAARALGISRDTMRYRIDKHGLQAATVALQDSAMQAWMTSAPMGLPS